MEMNGEIDYRDTVGRLYIWYCDKSSILMVRNKSIANKSISSMT